MRFGPYEITVTKKAPANLASVDSRSGWFPIVRESYAGAWQNNVEVSLEHVLAHPTVFACVTLIAFDVSKLRIKLVQQLENDIWPEVDSPSYSPVLRKPNKWQNRIQFYQTWMLSKLVHGNTFVLVQRDGREIITALYVLDPNRVKPLVAPDGSVYYELKRDDLSRQPVEQVIVPASEIIHDKYITLYHPLVGLSPLYASGVAATQGVNIQNNSAHFFANGAIPGGLLLAPGAISQETADRIKTAWESNYGGVNAGRVAVLGDNLRYEPVKMMSSVDSQLVEQLKWSDEKICGAYHVPGYKVGVGQRPPYNQAAQLNQEYYSDCIQVQLESIELLLDEGLGLAPGKIEGRQLGTEFDLDGILRMDAAALVSSEKEAVGAGLKSPNESRRKLNLPPVKGGESPMMQQQQFSLQALSERDRDKPFVKPPSGASATPAAPVPASPNEADRAAHFGAELHRKALEAGLYAA